MKFISNGKNGVIPDFKIKFNNFRIEKVDSYRYLGITLDHHLNFVKHIDYIKKKLSVFIGIFKRLKHIKDLNILRKIYLGLIQPHLNYGINAWGLAFKTKIKTLYIQPKKIMRIICKSDYNAHSLPLFKKLGILDMFSLIIKSLLTHIYRCLNQNFVNRNNILIFQKIDHDHQTRSKLTNN